MITKLVRAQLSLFVVISVIALTIIGAFYVKLPQEFGIGRYPLAVDLRDASGLYPKAAVDYRGVQVGQVTHIDIGADGGAVAHLEVDKGTKLPQNVVAQVHSTSIIGEQYVDMVPPSEPSSRYLSSGATLPVSQTRLPTSTTRLLDSVDDLLKSVPVGSLRTTVDELDKAFDGDGHDLSRIIDSGSSFLSQAQANIGPTRKLIDDLDPVLRTQRDLDPAIRAYARHLDSLSSQLDRSDGDIRAILRNGTPLLTQVAYAAHDLQGVLPGMLEDLATTGQVLRVYVPGIRQLLIIVPALVPEFTSIVTKQSEASSFPQANLYFKLGFDPPPCTKGFQYAGKLRDPSEQSLAPFAANSYCKVPTLDPRVLRGARNDPCPQKAGRGATAALCGLHFGDYRPRRTSGLVATPAELAAGTPGSDQTAHSDRAVIAPGGKVFLMDRSYDKPARSWQDLLTGLVTVS